MVKASFSAVNARLPDPARYDPSSDGRYEVKVGLHKLDTDFGNGTADTKVFQLDNQWPHYRKQKVLARRERFNKYICAEGLSPRARKALIKVLLTRLSRDYPQWFYLEQHPGAGWALYCKLTNETLHFSLDLNYQGTQVRGGKECSPTPAYTSALDALACQIQEDLAVVQVEADGRDRLTALHLCFPNHWSAQEKLGGNFAAVHRPVPGMEKISARSRRLLQSLTQRGPFVRFAWGLATDTRLNHHPDRAEGFPNDSVWRGRTFQSDHPELYLRIERQVTTCLPGADAFIFSIRTYFEDVRLWEKERRLKLVSAIETMNEDTLRYKGIAASRDEILSWLRDWN